MRQYPGCVVAHPHREPRIRRRIHARLIAVTTLTEMAGRPGVLRGAGPVDPDPGANTPNRYQNGASADPGTQHINVPDRALRVGNVNVAAYGRGDGR